MAAALKAWVRKRARGRCEYCHFPELLAELRFQLDHIVAQQHRGPTAAENLALACFRCNSHKGPNLSGVDPDTGRVERLFHPQEDEWAEHFRWRGAALVGRTPIGRTTVAVLNMNRADVILLRRALLAERVRF